MTYLYAAMWFLIGLILIFRMGRENRVFYGAGAFFLLLGGWWFADAVLPVNLFEGVWIWILRGITAVALLLASLAFAREYRKDQRKTSETEELKQERK
jgi:hypothetical protein